MAKDAATIEPRFVPIDFLQGRDDSGGPDFKSHSGDFGDGGKVTCPKAHLSANGKGD